MFRKFARREFLISTGALSAVAITKGAYLLLPRSVFAHELVGEEFCQFITFVTEPQTKTTSFFIVNKDKEIISPDSVVFKDPSGAVSFIDGTGVTYQTVVNEVRINGGFLIVNQQPFDIADEEQILTGTNRIIELIGEDPQLFTTIILMGAGALLAYNSIVRDSSFQPTGGLSAEDLSLAAEVAQDSLFFLSQDPVAEQFKKPAFRENFLNWESSVGVTAAPIREGIKDANIACIKAAANELDLKKCQAKHETLQKCLDNAINYCKGMCKAFGEAVEPANRDKAKEACRKLLEACKAPAGDP